ncbi:hypothetical protein [Savagea faecisuis]|uniref:Uncharacterized protein n=1 Tax=Savagea faecisuis TaxID=1274803 RepID=A0ABW3H0Q1_9BACL
MSNILKFLIVFGGALGIVLIFMMLRSPATMLIATSAPIVAFICFYFWTNGNPTNKQK